MPTLDYGLKSTLSGWSCQSIVSGRSLQQKLLFLSIRLFGDAFFPNGWNWGTSYVVPVKRENEKCSKNFIFCKNSRLENRPDSGNTLPFESHYGFALNSTNLSPMTNSESKRYHYPICPDEAGPSIILYPDSKVQREALYCPSRGPSRPPRP